MVATGEKITVKLKTNLQMTIIPKWVNYQASKNPDYSDQVCIVGEVSDATESGDRVYLPLWAADELIKKNIIEDLGKPGNYGAKTTYKVLDNRPFSILRTESGTKKITQIFTQDDVAAAGGTPVAASAGGSRPATGAPTPVGVAPRPTSEVIVYGGGDLKAVLARIEQVSDLAVYSMVSVLRSIDRACAKNENDPELVRRLQAIAESPESLQDLAVSFVIGATQKHEMWRLSGLGKSLEAPLPDAVSAVSNNTENNYDNADDF